jgi:hypothetical protein
VGVTDAGGRLGNLIVGHPFLRSGSGSSPPALAIVLWPGGFRGGGMSAFGCG